jgi:SAM-dependent methyltransferase
MSSSLDHELRAYYDQEAADRANRGLGPDRERWQQAFVDLVRSEGRTAVLELGCGPGRDAAGFLAAGLTPVGVDLSLANARLARGAGMAAVQGSLYAPPFPIGLFDAAWTMSTLVHVPDARFDEAMAALVATVAPGSPIGIGLWGGFDQEGPVPDDVIQPARFFSNRSHDRAMEMLGNHGELISFETMPYAGITQEYQFAIVRSPSDPAA